MESRGRAGFGAGVALFYSASSGSIKRALDTLLAQGFIEVASIEAGGRGRKVYRLTDAGRQEFRAWMTGEPAERLPVLRRITARIETELAGLSALGKHLDPLDVPAEHTDLATHQRATLDYGIASHRFALDWFRDHIDRLKPLDP
ncbi:PadR family transcriptional regulator [Nonomuraea jiangxiensis]|uniref:Virulence activator alpha C-term n=1 Tax=Nonomuraea jiangxiensis TaxID=633440 RepID=A0A1G9UWZ7_9ACTN|nr:PadR family transcriptional regulator [Nonomuraea jiangxiensis]SDM64471.1 Virulence activator alpha C-term [Nonomuraea jiangxiensis]